MGLKEMAFILVVLSISGCAAHRPLAATSLDEDNVRTFAETYRRAKEGGFAIPEGVLTLGPDIGIEKPYVPVYAPPRVVKVWVPAHVAWQDKDVMVAGHWTFVVVTPPRWYIEDDKGAFNISVVLPGAPYKE